VPQHFVDALEMDDTPIGTGSFDTCAKEDGSGQGDIHMLGKFSSPACHRRCGLPVAFGSRPFDACATAGAAGAVVTLIPWRLCAA
jgi:hypothetical protein